MPQPTQAQLDARLNPTPFTVNLPSEGEIFRDKGDNMNSTLYQIKNGQMQSLVPSFQNIALGNFTVGGVQVKAGQPVPENLDPRAAWIPSDWEASRISGPTSRKSGTLTDWYAQQGFSTGYGDLPQYNMADIQTALAHGGKFGQGTMTLNTEKNALATPAQMAASQAATDAQMAGNKGINVQGQTDANGNVISTTRTPLANSPVGNSINPAAAPGGSATTLYDYFTAKGQSLPSIGDRATQFEAMGLGSAASYKGSAQQNTELLEKLQLKDHAGVTFGAGSGAQSNPVNTTPAGMSLASALSGSTASETLSNYKTFLASSLGVAESKLNADETAYGNFFSTRKTADQILSEEFTRRGITQQQSILSDLDTEMARQQKLLEDLPENIRTTLADVGVSQAQLERLQLKEAAKPTAILKDLLTKRNALASDINTAVSFAEKFANTRIAEQAAQLAALQWQVKNDQDQYKNLSDDAKNLINKAIDEKKSIYDIAKTAAANGADAKTIDAILATSTEADAIKTAGHTLVKPKSTSATTQISNDVKDAGNALEIGLPAKGYNGRGPDGFVDPNLYVALYKQALAQYGSAGATAFMSKYPPAKNINPANVGSGLLPTPVENAVQAGKNKSTITIDQATIDAALQNAQ